MTDPTSQEPMPAPVWLRAEAVAYKRGQSLAGLWSDVRRGLAPKPHYPAPRRPRWLESELMPDQKPTT